MTLECKARMIVYHLVEFIRAPRLDLQSDVDEALAFKRVEVIDEFG